MLCAKRVVSVVVVLVAVGTLMIAGCGGGPSYEGPARGAVSGAVTFDGQPLAYGIINFIPQGQGRRANGIVMNGQYTIDEDHGPNVGTYKVQILGYAKAPADVPEGGEEGGGDEEPEVDMGSQILPAKYNVDSTLTAEITAGENKQDFTLTTDG